MSRTSFTIVYDGPALSGHTMDVRDLGAALLAVGQLCDAANAALYGSRSKVNVHVKATEPGCFAILLDIIQSSPGHILALLSGEDATAAANLKTLLIGAGGLSCGFKGVLWMIKTLRGKRPDKVTDLKDGTVRVSVGGTTLEVPLSLLTLYQDVAVRNATQKVVEEPLKTEGITSFKVVDDARVTLEVSEEEGEYFAKPTIADEILLDDVRRSVFSIVSLTFKEENMWRLNDGTNPINVSIEDKEFLEKVDNSQISFTKGDILICDVRVVQKQTSQGLKTEYTVIKVVAHRSAARQLPLPFEDGRS